MTVSDTDQVSKRLLREIEELLERQRPAGGSENLSELRRTLIGLLGATDGATGLTHPDRSSRSEESLTSAFLGAPIVLWSLTNDGRVNFAVGSGLDELGDHRPLVGMSVHDDDCRDLPLASDDTVRALAGVVHHAEYVDSHTRWISHYVPRKNAADDVIGVTVISVSEPKQQWDPAKGAGEAKQPSTATFGNPSDRGTRQGHNSLRTGHHGANAAPSASANDSTVLVVDDEPTVRRIVGEILKEFGFTVLEAGDGLQAGEALKLHGKSIALVVLDMTMPRLGGGETLKRLREVQPDVRVLLMSGYEEKVAMEALSGDDRIGFLHKPFTLDQLVDKVSKLLER